MNERSETPKEEKEAMWIWASELRGCGFRCRSEGYWQCERRFGLPPGAYLSIFPGALQGRGRQLLEVSAFHVTFVLGMDNIHFYYHEHAETAWAPGGHTSSMEIRRYGVEPPRLREQADDIAARLVTAWQGTLLPRE